MDYTNFSKLILSGAGVVYPILDYLKFYAQLEEELLKINANQNAQINLGELQIALAAYNNLTPAQFQEVQNYIADPNYQVDTRCWE